MTRGIAAAEQRKEAVQQATVGGVLDQNRLSELNTFLYKSHLGYLNDDTGDSFVEGFATWYAAMVQRHGLMPITNYTFPETGMHCLSPDSVIPTVTCMSAAFLWIQMFWLGASGS